MPWLSRHRAPAVLIGLLLLGAGVVVGSALGGAPNEPPAPTTTAPATAPAVTEPEPVTSRPCDEDTKTQWGANGQPDLPTLKGTIVGTQKSYPGVLPATGQTSLEASNFYAICSKAEADLTIKVACVNAQEDCDTDLLAAFDGRAFSTSGSDPEGLHCTLKESGRHTIEVSTRDHYRISYDLRVSADPPSALTDNLPPDARTAVAVAENESCVF